MNGLGKTSITYAAIKVLKSQGLASKVLIVAPLRPCYKVWPSERDKWKDFHGLSVEILHGPHKDDALAREADIYVINPEGLDWLLKPSKTKCGNRLSVTVNERRFKALGFDTLVVDELSKFKHPNTVRFKALKPVLHTFSRRWGLTGSPSSNGLLDLFGQCYVLDLGNALGKYITHYRNTFFNPTGYQGYEWVPQEGAEAKIYARLAPLMLRMAAEDYLELPELVTQDILIDLPEKAYKVYDELEKDLYTMIDKKEVVAANAASASMKCRQVASGGVYLDPDVLSLLKGIKQDRDYADVHGAKLDALEELIGEMQGSPLLVMYDFKHDLARLQKRLGKDVPYIGGGVSMKRTDALITAWNAGKLPVLLGHPQAIAHGLNLQDGGYHVCWFSLTWDYELYDQLNRRLRRQGSKASHVFVYHLLARGTVDEAVLRALQGKERGQAALFKALKEYRRGRG